MSAVISQFCSHKRFVASLFKASITAVILATSTHSISPAAAQTALSDDSQMCAADEVKIYGSFGHAQFSVELADTHAMRSKGLMFREQMGRFEGMLFVYDAPQSVHFWMKNTLIPLDMIFTDAQGRVRKIHENAVPHDETAIFGGDNILAVLEVNAGMAKRLGLKIGDVLQHPAYGPSAIRNCSTKDAS